MIPWFQYTTIYLGSFPIQVWGFFVALGMVLTMIIIWRRSQRLGFERELMADLAVWMIIGGLVGARLFHVLLYEPRFYLAQPLEMLKLWRGGLSSFGGIAGAMAGLWLFRKRLARTGTQMKTWPKEQLVRAADLISFSALFGWLVGRVGCVMIHDHLGKKYDGFLAINTPDGPRLEMALLEILALLPLAGLFFFCRMKKLPDGWFTSILLLYYGALRFILDFFRATDIPAADVRYFGLTPAQYFAIVLVVLGAGWFVKNTKLKCKSWLPNE